MNLVPPLTSAREKRRVISAGAFLRYFRSRLRLHIAGLFAFWVLLLIIFGSTATNFATLANGITIASGIATILMVSVGQTYAIVAGGFDLSVSGVVPLTAVIYAMAANAFMPGVPLVAVFALACAVGTFVGLCNGIIVNVIRVNPLITTLGMLSITTGLALSISDGLTQPFDDPGVGFLGTTVFGQIPAYVFLALGVLLAGELVLRSTLFGRRVYAIGGDRGAARAAGVRVGRVSVGVYALSGLLAAVAGIVVASELLAGSPTFGTDYALQSIAAVILGGTLLSGGVGNNIGTLAGVLIVGTLANGLALLQVPAFYQDVASGAVLLVAVGLGQLEIVKGGR